MNNVSSKKPKNPMLFLGMALVLFLFTITTISAIEGEQYTRDGFSYWINTGETPDFDFKPQHYNIGDGEVDVEAIGDCSGATCLIHDNLYSDASADSDLRNSNQDHQLFVKNMFPPLSTPNLITINSDTLYIKEFYSDTDTWDNLDTFSLSNDNDDIIDFVYTGQSIIILYYDAPHLERVKWNSGTEQLESETISLTSSSPDYNINLLSGFSEYYGKQIIGVARNDGTVEIFNVSISEDMSSIIEIDWTGVYSSVAFSKQGFMRMGDMNGDGVDEIVMATAHIGDGWSRVRMQLASINNTNFTVSTSMGQISSETYTGIGVFGLTMVKNSLAGDVLACTIKESWGSSNLAIFCVNNLGVQVSEFATGYTNSQAFFGLDVAGASTEEICTVGKDGNIINVDCFYPDSGTAVYESDFDYTHMSGNCTYAGDYMYGMVTSEDWQWGISTGHMVFTEHCTIYFDPDNTIWNTEFWDNADMDCDGNPYTLGDFDADGVMDFGCSDDGIFYYKLSSGGLSDYGTPITYNDIIEDFDDINTENTLPYWLAPYPSTNYNNPLKTNTNMTVAGAMRDINGDAIYQYIYSNCSNTTIYYADGDIFSSDSVSPNALTYGWYAQSDCSDGECVAEWNIKFGNVGVCNLSVLLSDDLTGAGTNPSYPYLVDNYIQNSWVVNVTADGNVPVEFDIDDIISGSVNPNTADNSIKSTFDELLGGSGLGYFIVWMILMAFVSVVIWINGSGGMATAGVVTLVDVMLFIIGIWLGFVPTAVWITLTILGVAVIVLFFVKAIFNHGG